MIENNSHYSIGTVERDTGIGRDTLRIWERRYGFPEPLRNEKGERIYSEMQLRRLQRIRRLLDQGMRPGKLLALSELDLDALEASMQEEVPRIQDENINAIIDAIASTDSSKVEQLLHQQYQRQGMQTFILETVVPLVTAVGELWMVGQLQVFQEHFLSQQLIRFLNTEIASMQKNAKKPLVLLATLPGEEHSLGLLMTAAMLSSQGISTINLGTEVPMDQIIGAVDQFNADIVGLTFSGSYQYKNIRPHLIELRELLSDDVEIWSGGEGMRRLRKLPVGVTKLNSLEKLPV